jgi:putative flippase GtrA
MIRQFFSKQFVLFLLVGGTAAAVNLGSRVVYSLWLGFSWAVIFAYVSGMLTAFLLDRQFVFKKGKHSLRRSALYFVLVNLAGMAQTWGVSMWLAGSLLPSLGLTQNVEALAHLVGVGVPAFTSFLGHRYLTFREA